MSRHLSEKTRKRLANETGTRSNPWGGRLSVALVYPNTYHHAMSNLGFQSVYHLLNSRDDALCERFFLPDRSDLDDYRRTGTPLFSYESEKQLTEFDLIAFSLSFENDYLNLPVIFELGRLPWLASDRNESFPLILAGGVCAFLNPEPLARVMDLFAIGEAEVILPGLVKTLMSDNYRFTDLAKLPGIYVPSFYETRYDEAGDLAGWDAREGAAHPVPRVWLEILDDSENRTFVSTNETEFGEMALTEVSRGCSRGCRFCAAGFLFLPPRERSLKRVLDQVDRGLCSRVKQGLIGPAVGDYSDLAELQKEILARAGTVSVASIRMDTVTPEDIEILHRSGHRTISLAPEAGSQFLRDAINKGVDEEQILTAVRTVAAAGIPNLKLYFLIGLPDETDADITAITDLTKRIRDAWIEAGRRRGRLGSIHLSVNPFVPKPFTPFQWAPMASEKTLKKKTRMIRSVIDRLPNVTVSFESPKQAIVQGLLSRGDRRLGNLIPRLAEGENTAEACRQSGIDLERVVLRERAENEIFPWEILDSGVRRTYLWQEYLRSKSQTKTPRCVAGCIRCGVC